MNTTTKRTPPQHRATLARPSRNNAVNRDGTNLARVACHRIMTMRAGELQTCIEARLWFNQRGDGMNPVYCTVWARAADRSEGRHASGSASGCGYHKHSAALADALANAGFAFEYKPEPTRYWCDTVWDEATQRRVDLDACRYCGRPRAEHHGARFTCKPGPVKFVPWHFGGTGDRAMTDALLAAARAMGWRGKLHVV